MKRIDESLKKELLCYAKMMLFAVAFAIVLKTQVVIMAEVPSSSMENRIQIDDKIIGNRLAYINSDPQRGDIVIFHAPDEKDTLYIKRVIGLPGDKIVISQGKIYVNDSLLPLEEDYLKEEWVCLNDNLEYHVPVNAYFMLGDNRNVSKDSRCWQNTFVTRDSIVAKAECIYFPIKNAGKLE